MEWVYSYNPEARMGLLARDFLQSRCPSSHSNVGIKQYLYPQTTI